jgi:rRNA maturation protein Nop10
MLYLLITCVSIFLLINYYSAKCPKCGGDFVEDGDMSIIGEYTEKHRCLKCGHTT